MGNVEQQSEMILDICKRVRELQQPLGDQSSIIHTSMSPYKKRSVPGSERIIARLCVRVCLACSCCLKSARGRYFLPNQ